MKTFYEKLNEGYYDGGQVSTIRKPQPPRLTTTQPDAQQLVEYEAKYEQYQVNFAEWQLLNETEKKEAQIRALQFKHDLFKAHIDQADITEYRSIIEEIYTQAYEFGHANGYACIEEYFADMLNILWEVKDYEVLKLRTLHA